MSDPVDFSGFADLAEAAKDVEHSIRRLAYHLRDRTDVRGLQLLQDLANAMRRYEKEQRRFD